MASRLFSLPTDRPAGRIQEVFEYEAAKRPRNLREEERVVWQKTNEERAFAGKPPVRFSEIEKIIRRAEGHIDYSRKLALGCEELVLERHLPLPRKEPSNVE
jgi:hypothetical protein